MKTTLKQYLFSLAMYVTYFASSAKAIIPEAIAVEPDVPEKSSVH